MNFFDVLIDEVKGVLAGFENEELTYVKEGACKDIGHSEVILMRDCAYELSGSAFNLVTENSFEDGIALIGEDLGEIKENRSFSRISVISIDECENEQALYELIRKIEYVKYHFFPEGYMLRSSSLSNKEAVRVSAKALKGGLSLKAIGSLLINKYKEIEGVKAVKVYFVSDKKAPFKAFEKMAEKNSAIIKTLNHVMNNIEFNCDSCNLKPVCDEVEGMRELHFKLTGVEHRRVFK